MKYNIFYANIKTINMPEDSKSNSKLYFFLARTSVVISRGMGKAILDKDLNKRYPPKQKLLSLHSRYSTIVKNPEES